MLTCTSPLEIWYNVPDLRPFLKRNKIIREEEDGKISIPAFKCNIEKPIEWGRGNKSETKIYPFWHQKLQLMLDILEGDYVKACESFNEQNRSFMIGKNMEVTVTIL